MKAFFPLAVKEIAEVAVIPFPPPPEVKLKRASPEEIARVRGEWERAEAAQFATIYPGVGRGVP